MKVGRSEVGSAAAQSHTASIAGNDAIFDAVLSEHGVVRARSTEELLDIGRLATRRIYPERNTLGVMTISGGAGVLISDAAEVAGLLMPEMPAEAQAVLKSAIPFSSVRNPVDCTAQVFNDMSAIGLYGDHGARRPLCLDARLLHRGGWRGIDGVGHPLTAEPREAKLS